MKPGKIQRLVPLIAAALLMLLPGCGSDETGTSEKSADFTESQAVPSGVVNEPAPNAPAPYNDQLTVNRGQPQTTPEQTQERIVIRNARMSVISDAVPERMAEITAVAEDLGGWVVNSSTSMFTNSAGEEVERGTITVRVPSAELDNVMQQITDSVKEVRSSNVAGEDVTQQFVDQQSRLQNLEAAEEQLQAIMDDANTTQAVLAVFGELVRTRGEIEVIQGQLNYWSQAAAYSSLQVDLEPPTPELADETEEAGWSPGETVEDAAQALIDGLKFFVDAAIWVVIVVLPFVLILGALTWIGYRLLRRFYPALFATR